MSEKRWILLAVLLAWAVTSTVYGSYYYVEYDKYHRLSEDLKRKLGEVSIPVDIAVDYGNGTRTWFNDTIVPIGSTVFNATQKIALAEPSPQYGDSFIVSINGAREKPSQNMYWLWWLWDETQQKWLLGPTANNEYTINDGQVIIWYLENTLQMSPPS